MIYSAKFVRFFFFFFFFWGGGGGMCVVCGSLVSECGCVLVCELLSDVV